jgi:transcriptional regulator with XRE-family HTH domain
MELWSELPFGKYLKKLRLTAGMSLREVESKTGISNGYLSQLENGHRKRAQPEKIKKLANLLGASYVEMMEKAGHFDGLELDIEDDIERAFAFAINDPKYRYGTRLTGKLNREEKKFIIKMYEDATGKKLLTEERSVTPKTCRFFTCFKCNKRLFTANYKYVELETKNKKVVFHYTCKCGHSGQLLANVSDFDFTKIHII